MKDQYQYQVYLRIVEKLIGEDIPSQSRVRRYVYARGMVMYQMREEGYTFTEIANQCGKTHASVIHMIKTWKYILSHPGQFPGEVTMWNKFQKRIENGIQ